MPEQITSTVHLAVDIDGYDVPGELGTITVTVRDGRTELSDVRQALGELLLEAGRFLLTGEPPEAPPGASQGVGESKSPGQNAGDPPR
ncbi:hypothetical protein [Streptomyces californicus]